MMSDYLSLSKIDLLSHLGVIMLEIADLHNQIGFARSSELQAKSAAWSAASLSESSVTAREKTATYSASSITSTLYDLEGRLRSLSEQRDYLILLVEHGSW